MLQLAYVSTARNVTSADVLPISRNHDATTPQVVTGRRCALRAGAAAAFARIKADPRQRAVVVLSRKSVDQRAFGDWSMAFRKRGEKPAGFVRRIGALVADASPRFGEHSKGLRESTAPPDPTARSCKVRPR